MPQRLDFVCFGNRVLIPKERINFALLACAQVNAMPPHEAMICRSGDVTIGPRPWEESVDLLNADLAATDTIFVYFEQINENGLERQNLSFSETVRGSIVTLSLAISDVNKIRLSAFQLAQQYLNACTYFFDEFVLAAGPELDTMTINEEAELASIFDGISADELCWLSMRVRQRGLLRPGHRGNRE